MIECDGVTDEDFEEVCDDEGGWAEQPFVCYEVVIHQRPQDAGPGCGRPRLREAFKTASMRTFDGRRVTFFAECK